MKFSLDTDSIMGGRAKDKTRNVGGARPWRVVKSAKDLAFPL